MSFVYALADLILYSNLFIALGAVSILWVVQISFFNQVDLFSPLAIFIFGSTWSLYNIHRLVGFLHIDKTVRNRRSGIIRSFRTHLYFYFFISCAITLCGLIQLPKSIWINIGLPGLIGFWYVFPLWKGKRLRDLPFLKLFAIAIVWVWMTCYLPGVGHDIETVFYWGLLSEKFLFILGITLPFDVRDKEVDSVNQVKTIPILIGEKKSIWLSVVFLILAISIVVILFCLGFYTQYMLFALVLSYLISIIIVHFTGIHLHDYFFTGLIDGTLIVQFILVICFRSFL